MYSIKQFLKRHLSVTKSYRSDLNVWETEYCLFKTFRFYRHTLWRNGLLISSNHLIKPRSNDAKYFKAPTGRLTDPVEMGMQEFQDKYKGNKWMVPINRVLNIKLP